MDLAKVFNTVNHRISCVTNYSNTALDETSNLMKSYLHNRRQIIPSDNSTSLLLNVNIGVPRGVPRPDALLRF